MAHLNQYPVIWPEVAKAVKNAAGWRCVRCGHPHESPLARTPCDDRCDPRRHPGGFNDGRQRVLTVHHLDGNKHNLTWWNLTPLCQVCHLTIQAKVVLPRRWMFEHSDWFKPYAAGWYAHIYLQQALTQVETLGRLDELLSLERIY